MEETQALHPNQAKQILKILVRTRDDVLNGRVRADNRIARKGDGSSQNIEQMDQRAMRLEDLEAFKQTADSMRQTERLIEKQMLAVLKEFPVYDWLTTVKGIGPVSAGWLLGEIDIHRATTVSKIWQFCGLNPGMVIGKKRIENEDGSFSYLPTATLVRGDKLTSGFVAPFNKRLRVALCGVMADGFIRQQNDYCLQYYYPYKHRLEQEDGEVEEIKSVGKKPERVAWKEAKKGHRDRAAKRYMVKMFLRDLYVQWRTAESLSVRPPYAEEYLHKVHTGTEG